MEIENPASNENTVDQKTEFPNETTVEDDKRIAEDEMKESIDEESENKENVAADDIETKEVSEDEVKAEGTEIKKEEDSVKKEDDSEENEENKEDDKSKNADAEWDKNVLFVSGMPPGEAGSLKQLLNTTLGADCHRIKPRIRGDTNLYVMFRSNDEMKVAESLLHNQKFLKYKLTAKVVDGPVPQKRPVPRDKREEPSSKKIKIDPSSGQQFLDGSYEDQISFKMEDVQLKLHKVAKLLQGSYPKYGGLIFHRQLKHDGLICALTEFKKCPPDECFATRCKFAIGVDEETSQPAVGIRVAKGEGDSPIVKDISTVNHNYPPHVIDAAKVFEKAVQASEKAPGKCKFWHELIIRTNIAQDLMLLVFVHCKQDSAADELKSLNEELKEFFENGEGKDCRLVALFTKAVCTDVARPQQQSGVMELVLGNSYLEETVMDFKLHLLPMMYFWNSVHAAKMVCEGVEELLSPSKRISVLEIGCGIGLIGFYLSKLAGEVLSVDVDHLVEEAKKNAERNEIKDIQHFSGKAEEVIPEMAKKIQFDKACAIVISSVNRFSTCPKAMEELRKIDQLKRVVLVTEMSTSRFSPIISLARSTSDRGLGNPFFPVKAIPVDTMPHSKSYVLLVLMERIGLNSLPKTIKKPAPSRLKMGDGKITLSKKQERKVFFTKGGASQWMGRKSRFMQRSQYNPYDQYQMYDYGPNPYQLQHMLAEERQRRMEVEEQRRWLEEEHRHRRMEERKHKNPVQDLISDSLKEAGVPQLNADAAQKLKQVIADAIKSAGVLSQEQQQSGTSEETYNSNAGAMSGTDNAAAAYAGADWSHTPAGEAAKQGPQPLMGLKLNQGDTYMRRPYHTDYSGGNGGYMQPDRAGGKPFYAASQDNMYGRQGNMQQNWNTGEPVQYPLGNNAQYSQGKAQYGSWQGGAYSAYDANDPSQRGGYRNMNQGKQRYFS